MLNVNLFDDAKKKEKIQNLPYSYDVVKRGRVISFRSKDIDTVKFNNHFYKNSAFDVDYTGTTVFKDFTDFNLFVYDNFFKLEYVFCNKSTVSSDYYLKNGYLHNENGSAYRKYNKNKELIDEDYYLNGRETTEKVVKRLLRIKKLDRLI